MARAPLRQARRAFRLTPGGAQDAVVALVPVDGRLVHVIPRELVKDQQWGQPPQLVERRPEWLDVVQHAPGHDGVEWPRLLELLERHPPVERPLRRFRVDGQHLVAGGVELAGDAAFVATPHLQHARRRGRQLSEHVGGEVHMTLNILPAWTVRPAARSTSTSACDASRPLPTSLLPICRWMRCSTSCCSASATRSTPTRRRSCSSTKPAQCSSLAPPKGSRRRSSAASASLSARGSPGGSRPTGGRSS